MAKPPRLECPEQMVKVGCDRTHFLLVINKSVWPIIGNSVVVLTNIGQHPQQAFTVLRAGLLEGTFFNCLEQRNDGPAVLLYETMTQFMHGQSGKFNLEVRRELLFGQRLTQVLQITSRDQVQVAWPRSNVPFPLPAWGELRIVDHISISGFHTDRHLTSRHLERGLQFGSCFLIGTAVVRVQADTRRLNTLGLWKKTLLE